MTATDRRVLDRDLPATLFISTMPDGQRLYYARTGDHYLARPGQFEAVESVIRHNLVHGHTEYPTDHRRRA